MQNLSPFEEGKSVAEFDDWYIENLVCPRDSSRLSLSDDQLVCSSGHGYPVVEGIPVMLLEKTVETLEMMSASAPDFAAGLHQALSSDLYLETLGLSDDERQGIMRLAATKVTRVDPVVSYLVAATNGIMYHQLVGGLWDYPIPELPLPEGGGQLFLDIGCSWGRWCFAAVRKGYLPVGLDPSLGAVLAARRVAAQLGIPARFVVGDARWLPFRNRTFDTVFSYSVIQHFSYTDARKTIGEAARVLSPGGTCLIQLPNTFGLRCLYHQARRGFRRPRDFEVRYWTLSRLRKTFESLVGKTNLLVDCYLGIGLQATDIHMMPFVKRSLIRVSELGKRLSRRASFLTVVADSIWVKSIKTDGSIEQ